VSLAYQSTALELGNVASISYLDEIIVTNTDTVARYLQLFLGDTTVPADTAVPDFILAVPAGSSISYDPQGAKWPVGGSLAFCLSTTAATKTAAGAVGFFAVRGS
jgi:hypothetical protein